MSVCRICLMDSAEKCITELEVNGQTTSYRDVFLFCLDILVSKEDSSKLCLKCYKNLHLFYDFKSLAQKNDIYWTSFHKNDLDSTDNFVNEIKCEEPFHNTSPSRTNDSETEFNENINVKLEGVDYAESDDELLSVIKIIQGENENVSEYVEEKKHSPKAICATEPVKRKKKTKKKSYIRDQVCDECGKTVRNLKDHMETHKPKSEHKKFKCEVCDKTFSSYSARYKHNLIKHLGVKKKCNICGKEVSCVWSHKRRMHEPARLPHACAACDRRFISPSLLAAHARTHTTARPFQCDRCEKAFATNRMLNMHTRSVHENEKSNLCQYCSKSFFKKYHLQVHLRTHSKERPYRCGACGKHFSSTTTLRNHQRLHSELKSFACQLCDMSFKTPAYLRNHMISHTKVKKHPCKYCGTKFGRSDHKKRHERTAHESHLLASQIIKDK